ncbi:ATP-binding protein [Haloarcula japonica]|nr:ATP-binding protein [Haloarcula japonica]
MPENSYDAAVRSPDVIRFLLQAQFDVRHGSDAFTHADLKAAAMRLQNDRTMPTVDDETLERNLTTLLNTSDRTFQKLMGGVMTRLDTVSQDARLRAPFNHLPEDEAERFDLVDLLDEGALIILDMGEFDSQETKQAITQVVLSNLWSALKRRVRYTNDTETDLPLVNLYLEEAATFEELDLLGELLDQSRSFGIDLTLITQFPAQFKHTSPGTYERLLNNVGTVVASQVECDRPLAEALATEKYTADEIENKLGSVPRGEWLVSLPGAYGASKPDPFQITAPSLPAGHPESETFDDLPHVEVTTAIADWVDTVSSRYMEHAYVNDLESPVVEVVRYYEPGQGKSPHIPVETAMDGTDDPEQAADRTDQRRFDVVGLDAEGEIVIVGEAEHLNNDVAEAVAADFDKMTACGPVEVIWVVPSRSAVTLIVEALNDPPEGSSRVEKKNVQFWNTPQAVLY